MSLSTSTSEPQHGAHVLSELLSELIAAERIDTKLWLRGEMDRLVDPMLDSIFQRLANKLVNADWDWGDGDHTQVMDPLDHIETYNRNQFSLTAQPSKSTYNLNSFPQHLTGYEPEFDPEILAQVKLEIKEEENAAELKNVMDKSSKVNGLIEDCDEQGEDMTSHDQVNNVIDSGTHLEPDIKEIEFEDYETTNNRQTEETLEDTEIDDNQDEVPFCSVENVRIDTSTPPHHNGQSQVIVKQPARIAKQKQTEYKEQSNEINNREDTEKEDDDEQEVVTFRFVKRPRRSRPSSSSTKPNTQIITHTFQCPQCGLMFAPDEFNPHLKEEHSIHQFRCLVQECAQSFSNNRLLCHHLAQFHQSTCQWYCDKCDNQHFTSYHGLSVHSIQQHQLGHFQCSFPACTFTGECKQNVYNHYSCQHKQTFKCDHSGCLYETPQASNLKLHHRVHSGIKPYRCKWLQCGHAGTSQSDVMKHIRRHLTRNPSSAPNGTANPKNFLEIRKELL